MKMLAKNEDQIAEGGKKETERKLILRVGSD